MSEAVITTYGLLCFVVFDAQEQKLLPYVGNSAAEAIMRWREACGHMAVDPSAIHVLPCRIETLHSIPDTFLQRKDNANSSK